MSSTGKITLWVVIILVVVVGGVWWWVASRGAGAGNGLGAPSASTGAAAVANPSSASSTAAASSSLPQGNSNQAINQEMTDINAQMNGLSSDTASVSQSMNDQPVQQTNP